LEADNTVVNVETAQGLVEAPNVENLEIVEIQENIDQ